MLSMVMTLSFFLSVASTSEERTERAAHEKYRSSLSELYCRVDETQFDGRCPCTSEDLLHARSLKEHPVVRALLESTNAMETCSSAMEDINYLFENQEVNYEPESICECVNGLPEAIRSSYIEDSSLFKLTFKNCYLNPTMEHTIYGMIENCIENDDDDGNDSINCTASSKACDACHQQSGKPCVLPGGEVGTCSDTFVSNGTAACKRFCIEGEYVANGECKQCPPGTSIDGGGDPDGQNTACVQLQSCGPYVDKSPDFCSLYDLYVSAGGEAWEIKDHFSGDSFAPWLSGAFPCTPKSWQGVFCSASQPPIIVGMTLDSANLHGNLSSSIGNLVRLTYLLVNSNEGLSGFMPDSMWSLPIMGDVQISNTYISGTLPPLSEQPSSASLFWIQLRDTKISGTLPDMSSLTSLVSFDITSSDISGSIPESLGALTNLRYLKMSGTQLSGIVPPSIVGLRNLERQDSFQLDTSNFMCPNANRFIKMSSSEGFCDTAAECEERECIHGFLSVMPDGTLETGHEGYAFQARHPTIAKTVSELGIVSCKGGYELSREHSWTPLVDPPVVAAVCFGPTSSDSNGEFNAYAWRPSEADDGKFLLKGCIKCPPGKYSDDKQVVTDNSDHVGSRAVCEPCPAGKFTTDSASVQCQNCAVGMYQNDTGQTGCLPAPPGTYVEATGQHLVIECSSEHFSTHNSSTACSRCAAGMEQPLSGQSSCVLRPITPLGPRLFTVATIVRIVLFSAIAFCATKTFRWRGILVIAATSPEASLTLLLGLTAMLVGGTLDGVSRMNDDAMSDEMQLTTCKLGVSVTLLGFALYTAPLLARGLRKYWKMRNQLSSLIGPQPLPSKGSASSMASDRTNGDGMLPTTSIDEERAYDFVAETIGARKQSKGQQREFRRLALLVALVTSVIFAIVCIIVAWWLARHGVTSKYTLLDDGDRQRECQIEGGSVLLGALAFIGSCACVGAIALVRAAMLREKGGNDKLTQGVGLGMYEEPWGQFMSLVFPSFVAGCYVLISPFLNSHNLHHGLRSSAEVFFVICPLGGLFMSRFLLMNVSTDSLLLYGSTTASESSGIHSSKHSSTSSRDARTHASTSSLTSAVVAFGQTNSGSELPDKALPQANAVDAATKALREEKREVKSRTQDAIKKYRALIKRKDELTSAERQEAKRLRKIIKQGKQSKAHLQTQMSP